MNRNTLGVAKCNDNEILNTNKPLGFIVRERIIDGKAVSLEYGIYLTNDIFLGVPVHYTLKSNLVAKTFTDSENNMESGYNYYLVPQLMQFAVKTYTNKKTNKLNPILVEPTEDNPAVFISCVAFGNNMDKILDVTIDENSRVIRKYIDKDRNHIGLILMNTNTDSINPTTNVSIKYGVPGTKNLKTTEYTFNPINYQSAGFTSYTNNEEVDEPLTTSFINLKNYITVPEKKPVDGERHNKKNFNKKSFN